MTSGIRCDRRAVIDVGTNSVKLLVADVGDSLEPLLKLSRQTRLGQGAFQTGRLQPEAIARTSAVVAEFAAKATELRPASLRILATSAAREAANGDELVQALFRATGLTVEIISGEQEADYVFRGVTSDPDIGMRPVLIVDVGGGSTEWVVGEGGFAWFAQSTNLGTSRLLEMFPPSDPPTPDDLRRCRGAVAEFLRREAHPRLRPVLASFCGRPVCLVGLGGALKTLARLASASPPGGEAAILLRWDQVREQVQRIWGLSAQERRSIGGLDPEKADLILAGSVIYEEVMSEFGFAELLVSSHGLRDGALMARREGVLSLRSAASPKLQGSSLPETRPRETGSPAAAIHA
jgi:exopolyphosphatase / guanosine-5'-triphosphate,3'-diphosphate pyrophosphatase